MLFQTHTKWIFGISMLLSLFLTYLLPEWNLFIAKGSFSAMVLVFGTLWINNEYHIIKVMVRKTGVSFMYGTLDGILMMVAMSLPFWLIASVQYSLIISDWSIFIALFQVVFCVMASLAFAKIFDFTLQIFGGLINESAYEVWQEKQVS